MKYFHFALVVGLLAQPALAHDFRAGGLIIHHPWIRQPLKAAPTAAAYLVVDNTSGADDTLLSATIDGIAMAHLHVMAQQGDVMKMAEPENGLPIPAGQSLKLKPKSSHIMLMGYDTAPKLGTKLKGTLTFAKAGEVVVDFELRGPADEGPDH